MSGTMLSQMLMLATYKHMGQLDKSGQPYILHPLSVMYLLYTTDEELQCIALGHDLLEDTNTTQGELIQNFTPRIVEGIRTLTRFPGQTYEDYKAQVKTNPDAVQVKLCDLIHNMDPSRSHVISRSLHKRYVKFFHELQALRP
jgi:(p)ppGpp synthase/HD superfamily hydrolase